MECLTLKDALAKEDNTEVSGITVILTEKKTLETAQGKSYLNLTVQDRSTGHSFKNFFRTDREYENQNLNLEEGKLYELFAKIGSYNGQKQIQNAKFRAVKEEDYGDLMPLVLPVYERKSVAVADFVELIEDHVTDERYLTFVSKAFGDFNLENKVWRDFLDAPAAKKHHGNKIHGLFFHTFKVVKNCIAITNAYKDDSDLPYGFGDDDVNMSRLITAALLHDIMKIEEYSWETGIKMSGKYQLGHIERGIVYLDKINASLDNILEEEELDFLQYAILSHHGDFGPQKPKHIENWILHLSDMIDAKIVSEIENN